MYGLLVFLMLTLGAVTANDYFSITGGYGFCANSLMGLIEDIPKFPLCSAEVKAPPGEKLNCGDYVTRRQWFSYSAYVSPQPISPHVRRVIMHETQTDACFTRDDCGESIRSIQIRHLNAMWTDIGWNWLIGTDGRVYEGRGWGATGSHSASYNYISYGIAIVGNYTEYKTSEIPWIVAAGTDDLLQCAVREGHIRPDYTVHNHRDVLCVYCPSRPMREYVKTIPHWYSDDLGSGCPDIVYEKHKERMEKVKEQEAAEKTEEDEESAE